MDRRSASGLACKSYRWASRSEALSVGVSFEAVFRRELSQEWADLD